MSEWVNGWVFEIEVFDARRQQPRFDEIISTATAQFVSSRRSQSIGIKTTHQLVPIKQAQSDKKPSEAGAMAPTLQRREVMVRMRQGAPRVLRGSHSLLNGWGSWTFRFVRGTKHAWSRFDVIQDSNWIASTIYEVDGSERIPTARRATQEPPIQRSSLAKEKGEHSCSTYLVIVHRIQYSAT